MESLTCPFCSPKKDEIVVENDLAHARYDAYPVNLGHILIIPFRHFPSFFEATPEEHSAILDLIQKSRKIIDERYSPDGYNIGVNIGHAAGQTVMHLHIHMIPRYKGDVKNARGGIRGVIPEKREY